MTWEEKNGNLHRYMKIKFQKKIVLSHSTNIPIQFKYCSPLHLKNSDKSRRNARGNRSYDTSKIASNLQANKIACLLCAFFEV